MQIIDDIFHIQLMHHFRGSLLINSFPKIFMSFVIIKKREIVGPRVQSFLRFNDNSLMNI